MNWLKRIYALPTRMQLIAKELADAERQLLVAQTGMEYSTAMATYHTQRIIRLRKLISEVTT